MTFRKIRTALLATALGLGLSVTSPGTAASPAEPIKIEKAQAWAGINQVVIGQFSVAFFTKKVDYDGGGFLSASSKGKAIGHLSGLTNEQYQAITDAVYADFLTQLTANGITVADDTAFEANRYYVGKVRDETQGNKVDVVLKKEDHADALAFWPTQLGRNSNALFYLRMMDRNMANTYTAEYDYAKTSGVPVLNVVYYIDFAKAAQSSGGGLFQSIQATAGLAVSPFGTQFALMGTDGKMTRMLLKTPMEESGNFATVSETTSGVEKVAKIASVLGAGIFGGSSGGMSARFDYNVTDPAAFSEKARAASTRTSDLFIRQMAGLR